jgi:hypothetical protein
MVGSESSGIYRVGLVVKLRGVVSTLPHNQSPKLDGFAAAWLGRYVSKGERSWVIE